MDQGQNIQEIFENLDQTVVIQVILVLAVAWVLITLAQRVVPWLSERFSGRYRLYVLALVPVLRLVVIISSVWLIIQAIIEPEFQNVVALLGAAGVALGFAFKDYSSSLTAGIVALYEMPYRPGDWIEVEGAYGEVKKIGMRAVEIVTPDDTTVVIPHLKLWTELIYNSNDGSRNLLCVANFYLRPRHDGVLVKRTLYDIALTSPFLQIGNSINVIVQEKPWGTHYRLKAYPNDPRDQFHFITDLTLRGKAALLELDVEFVSVPTTADEMSQAFEAQSD